MGERADKTFYEKLSTKSQSKMTTTMKAQTIIYSKNKSRSVAKIKANSGASNTAPEKPGVPGSAN